MMLFKRILLQPHLEFTIFDLEYSTNVHLNEHGMDRVVAIDDRAAVDRSDCFLLSSVQTQVWTKPMLTLNLVVKCPWVFHWCVPMTCSGFGYYYLLGH